MKTVAALIPIGALCAMLVACAAQAPVAKSSKQEEVARKGESVMPFDMARTTHFFDDTANGGIETITAKDMGDAAQAALIRSHLAFEAKRFSQGDFSDPAKIHGRNMPGLAELSRAGDKLRVKYAELPGGASLAYASYDPAVIAAIHEWFDAQRSDHAAHSHMH